MGADDSGNGISGVGNLGNGASGDGGRMVCDPSWEQWGVSPALRRNMVEVAQAFRKAPTRGEAILWSALRGKRIGGVKFRRQQPIGPFVVDFTRLRCA